jgi:micrococcal nuclease
VALQILPNVEPRSLPPVNPRITATEKIDPRLKELPELPKDKGDVAYVLRVLDGDTVELLYQGKAEKARLVGVDTPETKDPRKPVQCFGPEASNFTTTTLPRGLEARITWNPLGDKRDKYNRLLVYLWVQLDDDEPLELFNAALVRLGYARVYPFFKFDRLQEFRNFEAEAMAEKAGLWGACNYEPYQK